MSVFWLNTLSMMIQFVKDVYPAKVILSTSNCEHIVNFMFRICFPSEPAFSLKQPLLFHFLAALLMILSNVSTSEIATSCSVKGNLVCGKSPSCQHHNLSSRQEGLINGIDSLKSEFSNLCNRSCLQLCTTVFPASSR